MFRHLPPAKGKCEGVGLRTQQFRYRCRSWIPGANGVRILLAHVTLDTLIQFGIRDIRRIRHVSQPLLIYHFAASDDVFVDDIVIDKTHCVPGQGKDLHFDKFRLPLVSLPRPDYNKQGAP